MALTSAPASDAQPHAGRFVHLPEHHRQLVQHARLAHLAIELCAFARAFAHARKHRDTLMLRGDGVDQFVNDRSLACACAAEHADLAALHHRRDQVDDLHARFQHLHAHHLSLELDRLSMDRAARLIIRYGRLVVDGLPQYIEDAPQRRLTHRHHDRPACRVDGHAAPQPFRRPHRHRPHLAAADVHLHFQHQIAAVFQRHAQRVEDFGQIGGGKLHVDHRAENLSRPADHVLAPPCQHTLSVVDRPLALLDLAHLRVHSP
jgi:hypothetical protein